MSVERDLLIEARDILADYWDPSVTSMIGKNRKLYYKLKEYLEQPIPTLQESWEMENRELDEAFPKEFMNYEEDTI